MTQLIIDTGDSPAILGACRNMLNELLGERAITFEVTTKIAPAASGELEDETLIGDADKDVNLPDDAGNAPAAQATLNVEVDTHGVAFSGEFCGKSDVPFYASGKRKGQWKRRRGADEAAYDIWYAEQRSAVTNQTAPDDEQVDTAGAFGAGDGGAATAENPAPTDCGSFMGWVSAKQAGGLLTQTDIGDAYGHAGLQVTDLFPPKDEATVAQNVATLYQILVVKAGA